MRAALIDLKGSGDRPAITGPATVTAVVAESTNGTVTREVRRHAGGQPWSTRGAGQRWSFTATNSDGLAVYQEDEGGEVLSILTATPGSRMATVSRVSKGAAVTRTTSVVRQLDILGDVIHETEEGESTGQARLSRTTDFERNAAGFVALVLDPDGATTENVYDFLGRPTLRRQLRLVGGGGFDALRAS